MKRRNIVRVAVFILVSVCSAVAGEGTISGRVVDRATLAPVAGARVSLREYSGAAATDSLGFFLISVPGPGSYVVSVRHVAYAPAERSIRIAATPGDTLTIALQPAILASDEIVIQSMRTAPALTAAVYPADVIMDDDLLRNSHFTLPDAVSSIPGVTLVRDGAWETAVSIRGMSRSNIVAMIDNSRIETATDIAGPLSLFNLHDLDRVEVLKSPASALHGTGALGGVLQMVSRRQGFTETSSIGGSFTSDLSTVDGGTAQFLSLRQSSSIHGLRLSGGFQHGGDTKTPSGVLPNSSYRNFSLNGTLDLAPASGQIIQLSYQRVQADQTGIPGGAPIAAQARATYTLARRELISAEYHIHNLTASVPLLAIRASRQEIDRNVEMIQSPAVTVTPHATHRTLTVQGEATISPFASDLLDWGVEGWQRVLESRREKRNSATRQIAGERPLPNASYTSLGTFVSNDWSLIPEELVVSLGGRCDLIRVRNDEVRNPEYVLISGVGQNPVPGQKLTWSAGSTRDISWSAHGGVRHALTPQWDLSALVASAFRSPSLEERFEFIDLGSTVFVGNPELQPEQSLSLNAGILFHDGGNTVRVDGFYNQLRNLVAQAPGLFEGRPALFRQNVGAARMWGGEMSSSFTVNTWSSLDFSLAYVRGVDTRNSTDLPQMPPLSGRVEFRGIAGGIGMGDVSIVWALAQHDVAQGEGETPGSARLDLGFVSESIRVAGVSITGRAGVQNCLNADYRNHLSTLRGAVRSEPGRNFTLSVTLAF